MTTTGSTASVGAAKRFTCNIDGCGKAFATKAAKNSHRKMKHGIAPKWSRGRDASLTGWGRSEVYDFVDCLDLPDGAHWAMIEEISGYEPGDFA